VLAQERVVGATRDRIRVQGRLPPPPRERPNCALAAKVRDDQRAICALRGKKLVVGEGLEAREPLLVETIARQKSVCAEITEAIVVGVYPRDRRRDRVERVAPVDEVVGVLAEARELERLPAVGAELRIARVRPTAVAAVDGRARRGRGRGRRRPSRDGGRLIGRGLVAERAHALAELAEDVGQLSRAEDDQHDREDEEKLWATDTRHRSLPREACSMRLDAPSVDTFSRRISHPGG